MTRLIISAALVLTPAPITAPKEDAWQSRPPVTTAIYEPSTSPSPIGVLVEAESSSAAIASPVAPEESKPPEPPPPELTPIEAGMNRLAELGASPYQLRVFGCLAWYESKNNPNAWSATSDAGLWQVNRIHRWRWAGRDIFDPIVNAEVAWDIYRESGWRAWTTHWSCGV